MVTATVLCAASVLASVSAQAQLNGSWETSPHVMFFSCGNYTATLLPNCKILVTGGVNTYPWRKHASLSWQAQTFKVEMGVLFKSTEPK